MDARQNLVYQSVKSSLAALEHPDFDRPPLRPLHAELRETAAAIEELERQQAHHDGRTGHGGKVIAQVRRDIRKRLIRISTSALVALDGLPGIRDSLRLPHANTRDGGLLDAADRIIRNITPHLKTVHSAGLPEESIPQLEAACRHLASISNKGNDEIARRARATASLPAALRRARLIIRALDASIRVEYAESPPALHMWARAKRIPAKTGRPKKRRPPGHHGASS